MITKLWSFNAKRSWFQNSRFTEALYLSSLSIKSITIYIFISLSFYQTNDLCIKPAYQYMNFVQQQKRSLYIFTIPVVCPINENMMTGTAHIIWFRNRYQLFIFIRQWWLNSLPPWRCVSHGAPVTVKPDWHLKKDSYFSAVQSGALDSSYYESDFDSRQGVWISKVWNLLFTSSGFWWFQNMVHLWWIPYDSTIQ